MFLSPLISFWILDERSFKMKKTDWKYLVDTLLFISVAAIILIGILIGLFLAHGPNVPESEKYFLGLHRHQWGNIHMYISIFFVIILILHLILCWSWIKGKARQLFEKGWGTALMFTAFISLLVIFFFWYFYPKNYAVYSTYGRGAGERAKQIKMLEEDYLLSEERVFQDESKDFTTITGQMTLLDVEKVTGVAAKKIAQEIGLPSGVSLDETLGKLRKRYFFTMQDVRDAVASLMKK